MSSRPRRSAALRATEAITDMAESEKPTPYSPANRPSSRMSSRQQDRRGSRQSGGGGGGSNVTRGSPSSPDHLNLNIKVSANKLRQATVGRDGVRTEQQISVNSRDHFVGGEIVAGKRSRGPRKNYVVESDSDEEDEVEVEMDDADDDDGGDQDEDEDMDAEGEDMDIDADGEEDDDIEIGGGADLDGEPASSITVSRPAPRLESSPPRPTRRSLYDDDDDDELSDIEDTITYGETMLGDEDDAEGEEEIEVAGDEEDAEGEDDDAEGEDDDAEGEADDAEGEADDAEGEADDAEGEDDEMEVDSDGNPAGDETPDMDLSKMTRRQRARFEETPQEHMKLSDEVQVKKVFTAEELSMRRAEMARRRRNLSDKRNEEVKMETINKLLKKQAPKTKGRAANADDTPDEEPPRPNPAVYRWVSDRGGSRLALPEELLASQSGAVLRTGGGGMMGPKKMVEEVV